MITINGKEVPFAEGMTVSDAIKAVDEQIDQMTLVLVNKTLLPHSTIYNQALEDGSQIKLLYIMGGG